MEQETKGKKQEQKQCHIGAFLKNNTPISTFYIGAVLTICDGSSIIELLFIFQQTRHLKPSESDIMPEIWIAYKQWLITVKTQYHMMTLRQLSYLD